MNARRLFAFAAVASTMLLACADDPVTVVDLEAGGAATSTPTITIPIGTVHTYKVFRNDKKTETSAGVRSTDPTVARASSFTFDGSKFAVWGMNLGTTTVQIDPEEDDGIYVVVTVVATRADRFYRRRGCDAPVTVGGAAAFVVRVSRVCLRLPYDAARRFPHRRVFRAEQSFASDCRSDGQGCAIAGHEVVHRARESFVQRGVGS